MMMAMSIKCRCTLHLNSGGLPRNSYPLRGQIVVHFRAIPVHKLLRLQLLEFARLASCAARPCERCVMEACLPAKTPAALAN
jgi:hypothetical protein